MAEKSTRKTIQKQPASESIATPPPAYFLSLTVKNFRCFGPEQTLDLSDGNGRPAPWTVILGDNGVGKTTLLQCLVGMEPIEITSKIAVMTLGNGSSNYDLSDIKTISPALSDPNNTQGFGTSLKRNYESLFCSLFYDAKLTDSKEGKIKDKFGASCGKGEEETYIAPKNENIKGLICYGYGASRRSGKTSLSQSSEGETWASLFEDEATLINAEEWLLQADYSASKKPPQQNAHARRDQIIDVLINLLPDVTDIRISQAKTGFSSFVEVETPYGWVPIQGLSLGYRSLISWMVDFASRLFDRYPDSENPLAEPAVCLVDEIDLHLHPRWQRTLMSFLSERFPNTQFIATAHSPLVVQAAQNANIVVLRREGDHVVIDNDVKSVANWRVDQVLTSDLFGLDSARPPQLDKAMEERQKILSKARLNKADRARLAELEAQIGELPTGETPDDIEAMDIIRRAAKILQNGKETAA